jgi:hypothetical protein
MNPDFIKRIESYLLATGVYALNSPLIERANVLQLCSDIAQNLQLSVSRWDFLSGSLAIDQQDADPLIPLSPLPFVSQLAVLSNIISQQGYRKFYIIENVSAILAGSTQEDAERIRQSLLRILSRLLEQKSCLFLLNTRDLPLPPDLEQVIQCESLPLPTIDQIAKILSTTLQNISAEDDRNLQQIAKGLSATEIETGLKLGLQMAGNLADWFLKYKIERFGAFGLEFLDTCGADFGGLDIIRRQTDEMLVELRPEVAQHNIPARRGILLVGPPGTGKTHLAKCIARQLNRPLISVGIDIIAAGGVVLFKSVLQRLENIECVVLFDEIEKFFDGDFDSQVLAVYLTWLQEKSSISFVIGTLNRLLGMRIESLRSGRFDEVYWVGFPQNNEKFDILKLYARKYDHAYATNENGRLSDREWLVLLNSSNDYSGADLKLAVENAVRTEFHKCPGQEISLGFSALQAGIQSVTPLSKKNPEAVLNIILQARSVCAPSSSGDQSRFKMETPQIFGK